MEYLGKYLWILSFYHGLSARIIVHAVERRFDVRRQLGA